MTKMYYRVNGEVITSYNKAVARAKSLGVSMTTCYEPVYEESKVDTKLRDKRIAHFKEKAEARA